MGVEHPVWLPVDWKVRVRVRSSGKKDKYYINPTDGLKFSSKLEVLRHLKNSEGDLKFKELNKMDKEINVAEKLPSGWIKEIRIKKQGGKTGRDPYYIDPVRGHQFRSRKAESKEDDRETKSESTKSGEEDAAVKTINIPETNAPEQREKDKISVAEDQQHENTTPTKKRKKVNSKWLNGLPRRASKRLAGVEADPSLEVKTRNRARRVNTTLAFLSDIPENNTTEKKLTTSCEPKEHDTTYITENPTIKQNEPNNLPVEEYSSLEEREVVGVESSLNDLLMDPCIEFAIRTLTGSIPTEDVNKVDDNPVCSLALHNQASGSSSVLPSNDIWADPCIEFAVKMLTSEMPLEDGSHFQISFQQQQGVRDPPLPHAMNGNL